MPESKHYSFSLALCAGLFSLGVQADLAALEESELSDVTGAGSGFGFVLRDISLDSGNKNDSNAGRLTVNLGSNKAGDQNNLLMLSELKWKKAGTNEGFNIGTVDDPLVLGDVEEDSRGDYLVFRIPNSADAIDASYRLSYNAYDGFSDTITTSNINDYRISANAMRLIDSYAELWSVPGKGPAMASTINLVADSLVIDGDADSSSNATSINGVEIKNMKLGEKDQPLYVYTNGFKGDYQLDGNRPGFSQPGADYMGITIELAPLTKEAAQARYAGETSASYSAKIGSITAKSITFGDDPHPSLYTGDVNGVAQYAFTPIDPTENVIEIEGMEIQYMKFTPRDLAR
ncbi:MAG: hypothetical protein B0D91_09070 [Oceanospirillales bacterium LUC14_002_19_P2]|nr:MAG: hypothetical protein B0D91_09070 [Oceanospirillales bacterium LUC14_002_19_P2]